MSGLSYTPLMRVKDWGWHVWEVSYWAGENDQAAGIAPVMTRYCIQSETHVEGFICEDNSFPTGGNWATWNVVEENVEKRLRFESGGRLGGTIVIGDGWQKDYQKAVDT